MQGEVRCTHSHNTKHYSGFGIVAPTGRQIRHRSPRPWMSTVAAPSEAWRFAAGSVDEELEELRFAAMVGPNICKLHARFAPKTKPWRCRLRSERTAPKLRTPPTGRSTCCPSTWQVSRRAWARWTSSSRAASEAGWNGTRLTLCAFKRCVSRRPYEAPALCPGVSHGLNFTELN